MILAGGEKAESIRERNAKREAVIKQQYDLEIYWECEIHEVLKNDYEMKEFWDNCLDNGAINLRFF